MTGEPKQERVETYTDEDGSEWTILWSEKMPAQDSVWGPFRGLSVRTSLPEARWRNLGTGVVETSSERAARRASLPKVEREEGFYWIKPYASAQWEVYRRDHGWWGTEGWEEPAYDSELAEIGPRIEPPK